MKPNFCECGGRFHNMATLAGWLGQFLKHMFINNSGSRSASKLVPCVEARRPILVGTRHSASIFLLLQQLQCDLSQAPLLANWRQSCIIKRRWRSRPTHTTSPEVARKLLSTHLSCTRGFCTFFNVLEGRITKSRTESSLSSSHVKGYPVWINGDLFSWFRTILNPSPVQRLVTKSFLSSTHIHLASLCN